jgi:2,3-dihydroxy-p-cumate/2,3-dihydroxybenzoate 3,4-dioxygenase
MIRYRKLGFVELNVSDLGRSRHFYEELVGLEFVGQGPDGELRFRCGDDPYNVALHQRSTPGHRRAGWMLQDEGQLEILAKRLENEAVAFERLSPDECGDRDYAAAIRTIEPNTKAVIEFYLSSSPAAHHFFEPSVAKIQRLGHLVYATPRFDQTVRFYREVLNFAESDSIDDTFTFMRPWPSVYHHGIGIGRASKAVYHHTNFMVSEIDDIGCALHRFNAAGVPIVYGPGRHPASGSVFLYFLDPDGLTCEYSFGMEQFPEAYPRPPRTIPRRPDSADTWGAPQDPRMAATGALEPYDLKTSLPQETSRPTN